MTTEERFERIERVLNRVADNQARLDDAQVAAFDAIERLAERQDQLSDKVDKLSDKVGKLADAQAETDRQVKALSLAVESTNRQWQAYLNTIRPQ